MKSEPAKPKLSREQQLVLQILTARARGKQQYATAGAKQSELRALAPVGTRVTMPDGRAFAIMDQTQGVDLFKKVVYFDKHDLVELKS